MLSIMVSTRKLFLAEAPKKKKGGRGGEDVDGRNKFLKIYR